MEHSEKVNVIKHIRPNAEFVLIDNNLEWFDQNQTKPTESEIEAGWIAYQAAQKAEAEAKEAQRQALLDRLGITSEEAKILLGA